MKKNKQGSRGGVWCCRGLKVRKEAATQGRRLRSRPGDYKGQGAEDSKCGHLKKAGKTNVARTEWMGVPEVQEISKLSKEPHEPQQGVWILMEMQYWVILN